MEQGYFIPCTVAQVQSFANVEFLFIYVRIVFPEPCILPVWF